MKKLVRVGKFLRILDSNNDLSISNLTAIVVITKLAMTPATNMQDAALALVAILPYAAKKIKGN